MIDPSANLNKAVESGFSRERGKHRQRSKIVAAHDLLDVNNRVEKYARAYLAKYFIANVAT